MAGLAESRPRPPKSYPSSRKIPKLAWAGRYYSVWRREGPAPLAHIQLGTGFEPSSAPPCRSLHAIARQAVRSGALITFAPRPINVAVDLATAVHSPAIVVSSDLEGRPQLSLTGPGSIESSFRVRSAGTYELWLAGDADRPLSVSIDGHVVGSVAAQSGDDGNVMDVATIRVSAGRHKVRIVRGGGDLRPADNGSSIVDGIIFESTAAPAERETMQSIAPAAWKSLCGRPLDWIELTASA